MSGNNLVLVIDDSATIRKIVEITLKQEGFRVNSCDTALKALATIADDLPDLVLVDAMLPAMDGYQVSKTIKNKFNTLPVILMVEKTTLGDKFKGKVSGVNGYLARPINPTELVAVVKKHIK